MGMVGECEEMRYNCAVLIGWRGFMIRLKTERLVIRDPLLTDLDDMHRLISDPETMYYLQDIMSHCLEDSRQNLATAVAEAQSPNRTKYFFNIEHREMGIFIGSIGYTVRRKTPLGKFVGAGYFILPQYRGQGYVTEAMHEVMRFAFEDDGVFRLETGCLAENIASERVMQKCGLIKEAERKQSVWHDGRMKDRVEYRLLKDEWLTVKNETKSDFWRNLDKLIAESKLIIDRLKGSRHPRYPGYTYPLDYGYLENTTSMDGGGIDVWKGSDPAAKLDAIMCTVDLTKRDSEIKLLIGCTEEEKALVCQTHNRYEAMKGMLVRWEF